MHPCNFCFGGREACSESGPPQDPAPEGAGFLGAFWCPQVFFPSPLPPRGPLLAPRPAAARRACPWPWASPLLWQRAEMDGGGDPRSRAGSPPSCGSFVRAGSPLLHPSPPTPNSWARAGASDSPRPGKLHFRTLKTPARGSLPETAALEGCGSLLGWLPGSWGRPGIPSPPAAKALKGCTSLPFSRWRDRAGPVPGSR